MTEPLRTAKDKHQEPQRLAMMLRDFARIDRNSGNDFGQQKVYDRAADELERLQAEVEKAWEDAVAGKPGWEDRVRRRLGHLLGMTHPNEIARGEVPVD